MLASTTAVSSLSDESNGHVDSGQTQVGEPLSLRSNVRWTILGNFGFAACQWLILVVLAKVGSPDLVGQYALALGITAPIMLLANLNLRAVQSTDINNDYTFSMYLRLRLCTTALALCACLVVAVLVSPTGGTVLVVGGMALAKAVESLNDVFYGRFQKLEQMDRLAKSMLARGLIALLAMTTIVLITGSVAWGTLGMTVAWLVVLLWYDARRSIHAGEGFAGWRGLIRCWRWHDTRPLVALAWLALPLGLVQMLISLNVNIPRLVIQHFTNEHELGIYAAIAYVTVAGSTLVAAIGQAVSPRLAQMFAAGDRSGFVRLLQVLAMLFVLCTALAAAVVLLAGDTILAILYTPEYASQSTLLLIFTLSFGVGSIVSVLGFGLTAARRFRSQVPVVALAVLTVAIGSVALVPRMGIAGAAWSLVISLTVWTIGAGFVLRSALTGMLPASANATRTVSVGNRRSTTLFRTADRQLSPYPDLDHLSPTARTTSSRTPPVSDPVRESRWVFIALCGYVASQAYTVPIVAIGPWPLWPGVPDLFWGATVVAWMVMKRPDSNLSGIRRAAMLAVVGLTAICVISYILSTLLITNLNTISFGVNQQGPEFGLFEVLRLAEFTLLFGISVGIPYTDFRLGMLKKVVTGAFLFVCASVLVTFQNVVPSEVFAPLLPRGEQEAGAWWHYVNNFDGYGLGAISYTHAYVAAQITLLLGLTLHLRGNRIGAIDGLMVALALAATLVSGSRAGFAGMLLVAGTLLLTKSPRWLVNFALVLALGVTGAYIFFATQWPTGGPNGAIASIVEHQIDAFQPFQSDNLVGRSAIWSSRLDNLNSQPWRWFTGWGLGSSPDTGLGLSPHMLPLQIIMELGIGTLALVVVICAALLRNVWLREERNRTFFWTTIALLLSSITQETFYPVPSTGYFLGFYLVALAVVLRAQTDPVLAPERGLAMSVAPARSRNALASELTM